MPRARFIAFFVIIFTIPFLSAGDDKLKSGPKTGAMLPASFESFNVNGPAEGRLHSLVGRFALNPSVLIFAKEATYEKNAEFNQLLDKLEEAMLKYEGRNFSAGVVFLSADAKDATTSGEEKDADVIIAEAVKREALHKRLRAKAFGFELEQADQGKPVLVANVVEKSTAAEAGLTKGDQVVEAKVESVEKFEPTRSVSDVLKHLGRGNPGELIELNVLRDKEKQTLKMKPKHVILTTYPLEGPKKYDINPKADLTILVYERMKVLENYTFGPDELKADNVDTIMKRVEKMLEKKKS